MRIDEHAIPDTVCLISKADTGGKEDPAPSKDLLYPLVFSSFLPSVILAPPGGKDTPLKGGIDSTHNT